MKNFRGLLFLCLSVFFFTWLASSVAAEVKITPSIALREEYNDNIFLTATNKKDDFITSITPALHVEYTVRILTLSLDYGLDFRFYAKNHDQNLTTPMNTQKAKVDTIFSPYKDIFLIKVLDEYARVPIDQRKQVAVNNYIVNLTDSNHLFVSPYVEYPISGIIKPRFGYSYQNDWYKVGNSYENHDGFAGIGVDFTPNINASITYDYLIHRLIGTPKFAVSDNYDRQTVLSAATYKVNPKLSLNGSVGATWFNYKNSNNDNTSHTNDNAPNMLGNAKITYQLTELISLGALYNLGYVDSVNAGTYKTEKAEGTISYNGKIPLTVSIHRTTDTYTVIDRKDESSGITVNSSIPIPVMPKLSGILTGMYDSYTFNPGNEKVRRYSAGISFAREMRITTLTIGYTFNRNNSSIDANDYTNNIVYIKARFAI
jgi:hypothetical protein